MVQKHMYSRIRNGYRIKIINFNDVAKENTIEHDANQPQILGHPYKILNTGCSESLKTKVLINSTKFYKFILKFMNIIKIHISIYIIKIHISNF